jgi:hypothetical protein
VVTVVALVLELDKNPYFFHILYMEIDDFGKKFIKKRLFLKKMEKNKKYLKEYKYTKKQ